jgi:ADP-heptose:LPS heptosyltransferase
VYLGAAQLAAPRLDIQGPRSFVLAANGGLGDLCLAMQVLAAFKHALPDAGRHEWAFALQRQAAALLPLIRELDLFDTTGQLETATAFMRGLRHEPTVLPALLATSVNEVRLARSSIAAHLWAAWGMATPFAPQPVPGAAGLQRTLAKRYEKLHAERGFPAPGTFALFAPESTYLSGLKSWPVAHWRKLARLLVAAPNFGVESVVVCASRPLFQVMRRQLRLPIHAFDFTDPALNVDTLNYASVVQAASHVISLDSGTAHLASLIGARCVSLWGPTPPAIYASPRAIALRTSLCPPCDADQRSRSCKDNVCMKNIVPSSVLYVLDRLRP